MSSTLLIHQAVLCAYQDLKEVSDKPRSDAQMLLANILGKTHTWIMTHPEAELNFREKEDYFHSLSRYKSGEPLPYVLGWWEFFGRRFNINESVLIPRPETEHIVEHAIRFLLANPSKRSALDIGTGSGCIAVTLLDEFEDLQITATDISYSALKLARDNAVKFGVESRLRLSQMDLTIAITGLFDLIFANLPYIPTASLENLKVARNEPLIALNGGEDGLSLIKQLLKDIPRLLVPEGCALLELEAGTGERVLEVARADIAKADFRLIQDLAGHDRVLAIEYDES
ncbi:MAG: protein-(glutamine-N5) methyltransferase, release factor-specific [Chloroflexi bacterium RBG_16_48_8]|nr:MAG: protein-(glutamine-N5) methyltransferase, release factor-specific [Chloroflexi bacterium RBG_16_48_8]